jgi:very-short-patch-repair endonuclease
LKFKAKQIEIPKENPFDNDKLERKREIENLSNLLLNITTPIVLSINSKWGSGKTTFVKMLNSYLTSKGANSIYFNAWETDFATDPLLAFLGEINAAIEDYIIDEPNKKAAWENAKKAGAYILKKGIPVLLKIGSANLIDTEAIQKEFSNSIDDISNGLIDNYIKDKDVIKQFKDNIALILSTDNSEKKKLYVFIDELDRCRPNYAVELLERIKHILDIEGIVFVISLDKEQLARKLRNNSTKSEVLLWNYLKGKQINGCDFHRQKPIANYILDFYRDELKLAIEIDGESHYGNEDKDNIRQKEIEKYGVTFLRFDESEIYFNLDGVMKVIESWVEVHHKVHTP